MDFRQAIESGFRNCLNFSGRATRSEYWYWTLFAFLVVFAAAVIDVLIFPNNYLSPLSSTAIVALLLPGVAVSVRRLHDVDRSGWWSLLLLTVLGTALWRWLFVVTAVGLLVLAGWAAMKGTAGPNRFGAEPPPT